MATKNVNKVDFSEKGRWNLVVSLGWISRKLTLLPIKAVDQCYKGTPLNSHAVALNIFLKKCNIKGPSFNG